uniref:ARAD1B04928p n=1 Tax=Blastobotrys adeninivorans TaxID=409370 RepID=A0A060T5J7_BLAAD
MAQDGLEKITEIPVEFIKEGTNFINRCTKPDQKEYLKMIRAVGVGFIVMGAIGYGVKLVSTSRQSIIIYANSGSHSHQTPYYRIIIHYARYASIYTSCLDLCHAIVVS